MKEESGFDIVVTTYEMLTAEADFFNHDFLWQLVIVDEGHRLKNDKSQLSQKLKQASERGLDSFSTWYRGIRWFASSELLIGWLRTVLFTLFELNLFLNTSFNIQIAIWF